MKQCHQTKTELKDIDLSPIIAYLDDYHDGDLISLSEWLNQAIYMFHYLPIDTFSELERQNVSHVLMELKEVVIEIYYNQNR